MSTRAKWTIGTICAILVASLPATALAVFPGTNGKIAFISGRDAGDDAQADIYTIDVPSDLSPTGPLTLVAGQHRHPNWSPDGKQIVVVVRDGASDDVWLRDVVSGSGSNFTLSPAIREDHPTFSPDGTRIAYESEVTDGNNDTDILIAEVDGSGTPLNLTPTPDLIESTPVWSPDGEFIYYARKAVGGEYDILREPADDSGIPGFLLNAMSATDEWQPEISPDGTKLCFTFGPLFSANADVNVANIDGSGTPFELSAADPVTPIADYNCGWSPDGGTIAFTRGLLGAGDLQFAPSDGSGPITPYGNNSGFFDGNVDWSRVPGTCKNKPATIAGDDGDDEISGTPGKDVIVTFKGKDRVNGRGGNDRICSGKGRDTISGAKGRDKLFAGPKADKLNGGPDRDRCDGGPGNDSASRCERQDNI